MNLEKENAILPSSIYFAAKNRLHKKEETFVYVEAYSDVDFWHTVLEDADLGIEFKIIPYTKEDRLLKQGKRALEKIFDKTGKNLIICLDSDYDYLIDCKTDNTRQINNNKFIFQTYCYSIENMFCYPKNLATALVSATCSTDKPIDFEELLKEYSKSIYHLFLWHLYSYKINESFLQNAEFDSAIKIDSNPIIDYEFSVKECPQLEGLKNKVQEKLTLIKTTHKKYESNVNDFSNHLKEKGLMEDNCYLFVNGHELYSNIADRYFHETRKFCIKHIENVIKENAQPVAIGENIKQLKKSTIPHNEAIKSAKKFKDCFLYTKIQEDLKQLMV